MGKRRHHAVFINNRSNKDNFINALLNGNAPKGFEGLQGSDGALFSKIALKAFIYEEEHHDEKIITRHTSQSLRSMSSGEQKKALLKFLLQGNPDFLILDNPFDNLDLGSQKELETTLQDISGNTTIVQLISRKKDVLPFITNIFSLEANSIRPFKSLDEFLQESINNGKRFDYPIPLPPVPITYEKEQLIYLKDISVSFDGKPILRNINWEIKRGEFWQLVGRNGSGKTTLLSMVTGDNPKGYGQELYIFGQKKGSGESVWDIKKRLGYFTPSMIDKFSGYHTVEHMLVSGLTDSIGLYVQPTEAQLRLAKKWLMIIGMEEHKNTYFHKLTMGQQRLVMVARAMIKHPLLLLLDEPTASLDDESASLFVALVNKIAAESNTAIIFVSHREEDGLQPDFIYSLEMTSEGSVGTVLKQ